MGNTTLGFLLLLAAGMMNASFSLPMKRTRNWAWENTWLVWSFFGLLALPAVAAVASVAQPMEVYRAAGVGIVGTVAVFGFGWGIAQVLFGLALDAIGIALTFSIVLGTSAATGSLIPLFQQHREDVFRPAGLYVLLGTSLIVAGLVFCGAAGHRRERQKPVPSGAAVRARMPFAQGLTLATLSGLLAAFMNFGVAYGGPLERSAIAHGANASMAVNIVWWPLLAAGAVPNVVYCAYLLNRNKSYPRFSAAGTGTYWLLALLMAALWLGSTMLYGVASHELGQLGPVVGWPLFMSVIVLSANGLGVLSGEWKGAGRAAVRTQSAGIVFLVLAVIALSRARL